MSRADVDDGQMTGQDDRSGLETGSSDRPGPLETGKDGRDKWRGPAPAPPADEGTESPTTTSTKWRQEVAVDNTASPRTDHD